MRTYRVALKLKVLAYSLRFVEAVQDRLRLSPHTNRKARRLEQWLAGEVRQIRSMGQMCGAC